MKTNTLHSFKKKYLALSGIASLLVSYYFCLPEQLFLTPTSTVIEAANGALLGAKVANDGQWRFPASDSLPAKFIASIVEFEDRRFWTHPGFDPLALGRAVVQNLRHTRIVSGGSTISMQTIRLSRNRKSRTILEKLAELVLATRLELRYTKDEILNMYASNAPFGGNVVGIEAASWRYFGKDVNNLSWAEAATLAVLPNSPALIHPGKNRERLLEKRNRLLKRLFESDKLDERTYHLSIEEPLPERPHAIPRLAPHLLERIDKSINASSKKVKSTLEFELQQRVMELAGRKRIQLSANGVNNLAVLVADIKTGKVLAYVGNAPGAGAENQEFVDIITAPRSTGSILKPFLYALMMNEGLILPQSLVRDIPTQINGFKPENNVETYDGLVPVDDALKRSLNVPFVKLLQSYSVEKFHFNLRKLGFTTLTKPPKHYGLTLVLGGAEGTLWDIVNAYAYLARALTTYTHNGGRYSKFDNREITFNQLEESKSEVKEVSLTPPFLSADAIWFTFEAMQELERPVSQGEWQLFESSSRIAWKTGTSFGFRDAWAVGLSSDVAVGVWVGNADGEGRPGLMGVSAAAPILFDVFSMLPTSNWFTPPHDAFKRTRVCKKSGFLATEYCEYDIVLVPNNGINSPSCPFHQIVHLDVTGKWQVNSSCEPPSNMRNMPWFILPPLEEFYYKTKHPSYLPAPPMRKDCIENIEVSQNVMQLIYPRQSAKIYIPRELDGTQEKVVFKLAHKKNDTRVFWHIDQAFIGTTFGLHEIEVAPNVGSHKIVLVDEEGNRIEQAFEVVSK